MTWETVWESPTFSYFVIFFLCLYIYKAVFAQTQRLPILKTAAVYFVLAFGCIMLNFFHLKGLPIIPSLLVAVGMMLLLSIRKRFSKDDNKTEKE